MPAAHNLRGQRFGNFIARRRAGRLGSDSAWLCVCDCGNIKTVQSKALRRGFVSHCGCMPRGNVTHGQCVDGTRSVLYLLWEHAKSRARVNSIPFTLRLSDIPELPEKCPVLGIPLRSNIGGRRSTANSPSLDRIIPALGYVPGNVRIISHRANQLKNDATLDELRLLVEDALRITPK